jgi:AraC-like DNA-binding protein
MGFAYTNAAFKCTQVGGMAKLVLWVICEHANEKNDDRSWPSMRTIAREAGISPSTASDGVKELESKGLITVQRTKLTSSAGNLYSAVNVYRPVLEAMNACSPNSSGVKS